MRYKGYTGKFDYDPLARIFHGEVIGLNDVVTFQGASVEELEKALAESVEDYLDCCCQVGKDPEKTFSGQFRVRIDPDLHRKAAIKAKADKQSLNSWVSDLIQKALA